MTTNPRETESRKWVLVLVLTPILSAITSGAASFFVLDFQLSSEHRFQLSQYEHEQRQTHVNEKVRIGRDLVESVTRVTLACAKIRSHMGFIKYLKDHPSSTGALERAADDLASMNEDLFEAMTELGVRSQEAALYFHVSTIQSIQDWIGCVQTNGPTIYQEQSGADVPSLADTTICLQQMQALFASLNRELLGDMQVQDGVGHGAAAQTVP